MGMHGNLRDMAIADLIQINCQDRKSARLEIEHEGDSAAIYFSDGNVVHAVLGDASGEEVLFRILGWEQGTFDLETGAQSPATTIMSPWSGLLLEAARRLDEGTQANHEFEVTKEIFAEVNSMAPKFDDILKEMSGEITGFISCALVGMDGIPLASQARVKGVDQDIVAGQMTMLLKLADTSIEKIKAGQIEDDLVTTANAYLLMRFLPGKGFYLGVAADRKTGNLGNMRLISKTFAERLAKALPR
jgi:predicted regulator of Ras-like GTPase activity (Roadblock/LC7/MglB family)